MFENIRWLAKADFFAPTVQFGAVSRRYRRKYLQSIRDVQSVSYFKECVPSVEYGFSAAGVGFDMSSNDWLFREAEETDLEDTLIPLRFLPVAVDPGGNPLLLDVDSGRLCHFLAGYVRGQSLSVYTTESGFGSIPLTKSNVFKRAESVFDDFYAFFAHAREATTNARIHAIWRCIDDEDVEYLDHLMSLDLDLNVVNKEGRGPVEEAEHQGKDKLARMIRRYLDARRK